MRLVCIYVLQIILFAICGRTFAVLKPNKLVMQIFYSYSTDAVQNKVNGD